MLEKYPNRADLLENLAEFKNSKSNIDLSFVLNNDFCEDIYKNNKAFIFDNDFDIKPVEFSETLNFSSLKGYSEQKRILKENTKALLNGSKVNNILLYGDAGCGKSSSVRALLNEFEDLKMVQIFKNNLINLDKLYLKLEKLPYKFIIFADDISFDDFIDFTNEYLNDLGMSNFVLSKDSYRGRYNKILQSDKVLTKHNQMMRYLPEILSR